MKNFALCESRHSMPENVAASIFPQVVNPTDVTGLQNHAMQVLQDLQGEHINIFVTGTGLTVALIATLNACKALNISVTLKHFNRDTNTFFSQDVL